MESEENSKESLDRPSSTSRIFQTFQKLYSDQLKKTDESYEGLKFKVKILENWVEDLTEQNVMLVKTVEDLESEALQRICSLEENISQGEPDITRGNRGDAYSPKALQQIEALCQELEQVKRQLSDKENLISMYQTRIEQLGASLEGERSDNCNKLYVNQSSMTDTINDASFNYKCDSHSAVHKEETLVEVLGIKERSLTHIEQLSEQLEQKDQLISCLQKGLYRVRQQVDWFTENVTLQCDKGSCSEEFKKCITTMLEELKESIECCNMGPSDTAGHCKDSIEFIKALQKSLQQSENDLCQSWTSISDIVHELSKMELSPLVDQWKKELCKQKCLQQKIQDLIKSITNITSSSDYNIDSFTKSMDSLHTLLLRFKRELNCQPNASNISSWLNNLHCLVTESTSKIQELSGIISTIKDNDKKIHSELLAKMEAMDALQWDLSDSLCTQLKGYEKLSRREKCQRTKLDTLLATVLHHQEMWNQQAVLTNDVLKEISSLSENLKRMPRTRENDTSHGFHVQSIVAKISADIKKSLSDIEQRQNQVSHLELDLSSVRIVLESAQQEINDISKQCDTKDVKNKLAALLTKLKKQITNALTKADNLVKVYGTTKKEYINSSERIVQFQREWDALEREMRGWWSAINQDFRKHTKPKKCPSQVVLEDHQRKSPRKEKQLQRQFVDVQKTLDKEDAAIKRIRGNVMELKSNIKDRDRLTDTQDKTICVLENSLKLCQREAEELRKTIHTLEVEKCGMEIDSRKEIQKLKSKIADLQNTVSKYEDCGKKHKKAIDALKLVIVNLKENVCKEKKKRVELQNKNELLEGQLQKELKRIETEKDHKEEVKKLLTKIGELKNNLKQCEETVTKYHKSEAALQIVIANLKETITKENKKNSDLEKEIKKLREQIKDLEENSKKALSSNEETNEKMADLKKQVKCWSKRVADLEEQLKQCKKCEKDLQQELLLKDTKHKEEICAKQAEIYEKQSEICAKQKEISMLTEMMKSMNGTLNETATDLDRTKVKFNETEDKLHRMSSTYEELKIKVREKEAMAEKLQVALTQLSNKFVSRRLDNTGCIRHYQEECAKFEALYNTATCKLRSKEVEVCSLKQEIERMKQEISLLSRASSQPKEEDNCPFLMERVHHLSKELQVAHSCQNSYEKLIKDLTDKCSKKEEEILELKSQLKQTTSQRDTLLMDLERAQEDLRRLKVENSSLQAKINKLEHNKAHITDQLQKTFIETDHQIPDMQPNIELQRQISTALSNQLRGVKQKLHTTKHDYKLLQAAYEDLNHKYKSLQRGERDLDQVKDVKKSPKPTRRCPCLNKTKSKSSKSLTYIGKSEVLKEPLALEYPSHSKSWHKIDNSKDLDIERKWKHRIQKMIADDLDTSDVISSSNEF